MFTVAAAPLRIPNARITGAGIRSCGWLILKFSNDLGQSRQNLCLMICSHSSCSFSNIRASNRSVASIMKVRISIPFSLGSPVLIRRYLRQSSMPFLLRRMHPSQARIPVVPRRHHFPFLFQPPAVNATLATSLLRL